MVKSKFVIKHKDENVFYKSFLLLKNEKEAKNFLRDLLTIDEINDFAGRLLIARMIYAGKSYNEVQSATQRSTTTIARVSKWLKNGMGGYKKIILRISKNENKR